MCNNKRNINVVSEITMMALMYKGNKRNQHVQCDRILEEKLKSRQKSIGSECKPDMRTIGVLAGAPLRHCGVNTEVDVDFRINMCGIENVLHELRIIPELQSQSQRISDCSFVPVTSTSWCSSLPQTYFIK